jgi:hypothetical protein
LVKAVDYSDSIEYSEIEGNARMSLGTSEGMYRTDEASMELYLAEFDEVQDTFAEKMYSKRFTVTAAYTIGGKTRTDTLVGCRWVKRTASNQTGADALTRTLPFKPAYIKWNGKNPLEKMPAGAN